MQEVDRLDSLIDGTAEDGPSSLLTAVDASGCPRIVKLLNRRVSLESSEQPGGAEAAAFRRVCDNTAAIVQAELIDLRLLAGHGYTAHGPGNMLP